MPEQDARSRSSTQASLTLLALGVVYGDIGTSPLYAVKETFSPSHGIALVPENIIGGASTIFWALMIVVSLKYVTLVLRANNRGEGGIMALLALATSSIRNRPRLTTSLLLVGVFGASLFYGDAILTPAISVLSAVEGLAVGTSAFQPYVVPIAVALLVLLFIIQKRGTKMVGSLFGPVCVVWFIVLAASGIWEIIRQPVILKALDPRHALHFATGHGLASFAVLGSVLLAFFLAAVVGFGSSSRLASAYGVAVMGTMVATTFLTFFVVRYRWDYPLWLCLFATGAFMVIDLTFFAAAMHKVFEGGWFPLLFGSVVFTVMMTWRRGREILYQKLNASSVPLSGLLESLFHAPPQRGPGTAVFFPSLDA